MVAADGTHTPLVVGPALGAQLAAVLPHHPGVVTRLLAAVAACGRRGPRAWGRRCLTRPRGRAPGYRTPDPAELAAEWARVPGHLDTARLGVWIDPLGAGGRPPPAGRRLDRAPLTWRAGRRRLHQRLY